MSKWSSKRRENSWEEIENPIFIFCGGEKTEPNYFQGFKDLIEHNAIYKNLVKIEILIEPSDTIRILDKAIEYIKENNINRGEVWCIFDKDDFPEDDFNNAVYKAETLNKQSNIKYYTGWSNECIELWFLLHFCYYNVDNGRQDYIEKLNKYLIENGEEKYKKNNERIFNILFEKGNITKAIQNARKLEEINKGKTPAKSIPGTTINYIVEKLLKYVSLQI